METAGCCFFDLFFTLIKPEYCPDMSENEVLGLSIEEWEFYAEDKALYLERAGRFVTEESKIIEDITMLLPMQVNPFQKKELLRQRKARMRHALMNVDGRILEMLERLKLSGWKLCLISNADVIDCMYWKESPLFSCFDKALFSCCERLLKPDVRIYQRAMQYMNCTPEQSIFIGDGGSDELRGAENAGMKTVFTEYLERKPEERRWELMKEADWHITDIAELPGIVGEKIFSPGPGFEP